MVNPSDIAEKAEEEKTIRQARWWIDWWSDEEWKGIRTYQKEVITTAFLI